MSIKKIIILVTIALVNLVACTKDHIEYATSADEVATELQQTIEVKDIDRVYPVQSDEPLPNTYSASGGTAWSFSNGFISINYGFNQAYNLANLRYYEVTNVTLDDGSAHNALLLFF